jgi:peptidoglycan DL-endopeptidase CwlO
MACAVVGLGVVAGSATADPSVSSKQRQAQEVLAQIQEIQGRVERASNAYYSATVKLRQIDGDLRLNTTRLGVARQSLGVAQTRVAARLRALYMSGSRGGTVEILLGAQNLDDLLNRLETAKRVSRQDTQVLRQVRAFRREVEQRQAALRDARASQSSLVAERAAQKRSIEGQLSEQQRLYNSIKDEIARLKAAELRRQALLAAQARARYLRQIQAQRQQALQAAVSESAVQDISAVPGGLDAVPPAPPSRYGGVVGIALQYLGTPYVWGASGPGAFDCSGFTSYVFAQVGVSLPHNAAAQYGYGVPVSRDDLQPGDLVFFDGLGHVGIYIGGGQFVHAPHTGDVVKISSVYDSWYAATWVGARRL